MSTEQSQLPLFPGAAVREISRSQSNYFQTLAYQLPLRLVDTTTGGYAEDAPPAGLDVTTAQGSNQNQEITYLKKSADANVFTLNGVEGGPYFLTAQYDRLRIKSDGTNWWRID